MTLTQKQRDVISVAKKWLEDDGIFGCVNADFMPTDEQIDECFDTAVQIVIANTLYLAL